MAEKKMKLYIFINSNVNRAHIFRAFENETIDGYEDILDSETNIYVLENIPTDQQWWEEFNKLLRINIMVYDEDTSRFRGLCKPCTIPTFEEFILELCRHEHTCPKRIPFP